MIYEILQSILIALLGALLYVTIREAQALSAAITDIDERTCELTQLVKSNANRISNQSDVESALGKELLEQHKKLEKVFEIAAENRNELTARHMRERNESER